MRIPALRWRLAMYEAKQAGGGDWRIFGDAARAEQAVTGLAGTGLAGTGLAGTGLAAARRRAGLTSIPHCFVHVSRAHRGLVSSLSFPDR